MASLSRDIYSDRYRPKNNIIIKFNLCAITIKINLFKYKKSTMEGVSTKILGRATLMISLSGNQLLLFFLKSGCFGIRTLGKTELTISLEN